jgi:hypothetical protein
MKKNVSELKQDLAAANKQIKLAKESGNKRQLNLGRQQRLDAWRVLRDEHGMEAPSHIAKALGAPKKKEPSEFTKPKEEAPKEETMVFTTVELYGAKEAAKMAKADEKRERMLAKMTPKQKKEYWATQEESPKEKTVAMKVEMPKKKAITGEMRVRVRAWLSKDIEYLRAVRKIAKHRELAEEASKLAKKLGPKKSDELMKALDALHYNTMAAADAERQLRNFLEKKEAQFKKEHSSDLALVKTYSADLKKFSEDSYLRFAIPFSDSEKRIMTEVSYNYTERRSAERKAKMRAETKVKGKNRLEEEMKKMLLEKAQDLIEDLEDPTPEERKTMHEIEKAASNPSVDSSEMLRIAVGRENLTEDEASSVELALAGETVDRLETKVAVAGTRKPVNVASRGRKGKKPIEVASLERKKKEKEV